MDRFLPGATFGRYRIEGIVGRGGMAAVYRATELALSRQVALKVMVSAAPRLRSEALAAAAIEHPHVVPVYDLGSVDGVPYIAMRLIEGPSLAEVVARGPLEPRRAVALIVQVAGALEAAHARGVLHRDVKPANVLLDGDHAYVTDFGVAHRMTEVAPEVVGTPGYLAPEVLRGEPVGVPADVFSLGCTLVEMLTGSAPQASRHSVPPTAASPEAATRGLPAAPRPHRPHDAAPPGRDLAARPAVALAGLDELLARTLSDDPADRPQSAAEFAALALAAVDRRRASRASVAPPRGNVPAVVGRLIGRSVELAALVDACRAEGGIVSLVGPGGVGKTRLALAVADAVADDFDDGCFVVELESIGSAADVIGAIGRTLGLPDDTLVERHLRGREVMLILDNFEQVVDAAVDVARLGVRVLVTSQTPLRVRGERVIRLGPLELPDASVADPAKLAEVPSVALLVAHARAMDSSFALTAANAADVARICAQLDGLPLALELAAARLALFGPAELSSRLEAGLGALGQGPRDLPPRQRGLRAALDWTCSLLSDGELALFLRLAVFAGGFTSALVEAVASEDLSGQGVDNSSLARTESALELFGALFDVALVRRERGDRYAISPPVRLYALERLGDEIGAARVRQGEALIELAEAAEALWWTDIRASKQAFMAEAQNISEALTALRERDPLLHARLLAAAARWFSDSGRSAESVAELDFALASEAVRGELRARLLCRRAIAVESDDPLAASEVAVAASREFGTGRDLVEALFGLSTGYSIVGDGEGAMRTAREAQTVARELNDRVATDLADLATGTALAMIGRPAEALALVTLLDRRVPPGGRIAMNTTIARADTALACGDPMTALKGYGRWLRQYHALNSYFNEAFQLDGAAMALTALERFEEAVIAAEISDLLRREWTIDAPPVYRDSRDAQLARSYTALGPAGVEQAQATARRLGPRHGPLWVASHVDPAPTLQSSPSGAPSPIPANRG